MADETIGDLGDATLPLAAGDYVPVWQGGPNALKAPNSAVGTLQGFAYDPDTSDFANGVFGYTSGSVNANGNASGTSGDTITISGDSGFYQIYLSAIGSVSFRPNSQESGNDGSVPLHTVELTGTAITYNPATGDNRAWLSTSSTLRSLAIGDSPGRVWASNGDGTAGWQSIQTIATNIPVWTLVCTLTHTNFANGTLSGADAISTVDAYTTSDDSNFGGAVIHVTEAFDGPTIAAAALNASAFTAALSAVNMIPDDKTPSFVPRTTLASGAIQVIATLTGETWPDMTAGSLDIYVLLSRVIPPGE